MSYTTLLLSELEVREDLLCFNTDATQNERFFALKERILERIGGEGNGAVSLDSDGMVYVTIKIPAVSLGRMMFERASIRIRYDGIQNEGSRNGLATIRIVEPTGTHPHADDTSQERNTGTMCISTSSHTQMLVPFFTAGVDISVVIGIASSIVATFVPNGSYRRTPAARVCHITGGSVGMNRHCDRCARHIADSVAKICDFCTSLVCAESSDCRYRDMPVDQYIGINSRDCPVCNGGIESLPSPMEIPQRKPCNGTNPVDHEGGDLIDIKLFYKNRKSFDGLEGKCKSCRGR